MKAAVMHDVNRIVFEEVPTPSPGKGELLVKVGATRVCATDVNMYHGRHPGPFLPRILGHECSGEVTEVGEGIHDFRAGDRIGIDPIIYCGQCYFCRMGRNNLCENGGLMGRETNGSFAEYTIITPERAVKIPNSISLDVACFMEAMGSIYHGATLARLMVPHASVAVIGLGSIGMMQIQYAKLAGCDPVIGITRSQWKLDLAKELGADFVLDASDEDFVEGVKKITPHGGADVVIEAAGVPDTIRKTFELVRPGGEIIQYGIGPTYTDNINTYLQYYKEITIYGVRALNHNDFVQSVSFLDRGGINIERIITHRFALEKTAEGLELAENPAEKVLGIVIGG